jgi:zinc resistance-associated protein
MALSLEDRQAFANAKFAGLKAALKLTAAQEKSWPAVEATLLDVAKARQTRRGEVYQARVQQKKQSLDITARLRDRAKGLRSRADQALLDSLDEAQKRRFGLVLRGFSRRRIAMRQWGRMVRRLKPTA